MRGTLCQLALPRSTWEVVQSFMKDIQSVLESVESTWKAQRASNSEGKSIDGRQDFITGLWWQHLATLKWNMTGIYWQIIKNKKLFEPLSVRNWKEFATEHWKGSTFKACHHFSEAHYLHLLTSKKKIAHPFSEACHHRPILPEEEEAPCKAGLSSDSLKMRMWQCWLSLSARVALVTSQKPLYLIAANYSVTVLKHEHSATLRNMFDTSEKSARGESQAKWWHQLFVPDMT